MTERPTPNSYHIPQIAEEDLELRRLGGTVPIGAAGKRADVYLAMHFPFLSRSAWKKRIRNRILLVNGAPVRPATRLRGGDELGLCHVVTAEPEVDTNISVLWEEAGVMAVHKPGNLPMHEGGPYRKNTFARVLSETVGPQWAAVHRLDRETSGIVLCASTPELRAQLAIALESRKVKKEYKAIVKGEPEEDKWTVDAPIGDSEGSQIRIKKWVSPGGLSALTHFEVLGRSGGHALLLARPVTGRTNQIRVHSAYSGYVLLGDILYHPDEDVFLDYFENGRTALTDARTGFARHCLHAAAIEFVHPATGRLCRIEAPLPPDMLLFCKEQLQLDEATIQA